MNPIHQLEKTQPEPFLCASWKAQQANSPVKKAVNHAKNGDATPNGTGFALVSSQNPKEGLST